MLNAQELANKMVIDALEVSGPYTHCTEAYFFSLLMGFKATARALGLPAQFDTDTAHEAAELASARMLEVTSASYDAI